MTSTHDLTGSTVRRRGRTPKRMAAGRVCIELDCTTKLSIYNRRDTCFLHCPVRFPRTRGHTKTGTNPTPIPQ